MLLSNNKYTNRMQVLLFALFTASLTVVLHGIGTEHNWYWTYPWFDVITHLLGGISLGSLTMLVYRDKKRSVALSLGTVLVLVIGWEVFEVLFVNMPTEELGYSIGTAKDMIVGLGGAYAAMMFCKKDPDNPDTAPTT